MESLSFTGAAPTPSAESSVQYTVTGSATATRDLPGPGRSVVPAPVMQAASLAALADVFAVDVDKVDDNPA